jgi:hypothetical protein
VVAGGGFLSYWNHQLIKYEEKKRFGEKILARYPCSLYTSKIFIEKD